MKRRVPSPQEQHRRDRQRARTCWLFVPLWVLLTFVNRDRAYPAPLMYALAAVMWLVFAIVFTIRASASARMNQPPTDR